MNLLNPSYNIIAAETEKFLYGSSMIIIAFLALMLSTPDVSMRKRAGIIVIGAIGFFLTDLLFIQYVIFPQGQPVINEDSPAFEMYLCIKWLLPFMLWIVMSYPLLGGLFNAARQAGEET